MDPKVWGKLLTHHRRCYGVDVEALWSIPPPAERWKRPQDGISRVQKVATVEIGVSWCSRMFSGYMSIYIGERSRSGGARGAHEGGGMPTPLGALSYLVNASLLPWRTLQVSWIAFVPKTILPKVSFRLDYVWYSFSMKHWNRKKIAICTGPPVNRLVPKII